MFQNRTIFSLLPSNDRAVARPLQRCTIVVRKVVRIIVRRSMRPYDSSYNCYNVVRYVARDSYETRTSVVLHILARSDRFHSIKMPPKRKIRGNKRRNDDGQWGDQESQPEETTSPATTTTTPAAAAASATPQGLTHHLLLCLSYICLLLINIPNNITSLC